MQVSGAAIGGRYLGQVSGAANQGPSSFKAAYYVKIRSVTAEISFVQIKSVTAEILLIWNNGIRTNVAWTNVTVTVFIC